MIDDEVIVLGDMVDLAGQKNRMYRTKIEDVAPHGLFLIGVPRFGGTPMPLHVNDNIFLVYYRQTGRFIVRMNVVGFEKRGHVRYAWLFQKTEPYKDQRREAFRVPISLEISVCEYTDDTEAMVFESEELEDVTVLESVNSRDISVTGISFLTKADYLLGERRLIKVFIYEKKGEPQPFVALATVARSTPWRESGKNLVGLRFYGLTKDKTELISKYVLEAQRKQLKQKRLLEGD